MHYELEREVVEDAAAYEALEKKSIFKDRGLDDLDAALKFKADGVDLAVESLNEDQRRVFHSDLMDGRSSRIGFLA